MKKSSKGSFPVSHVARRVPRRILANMPTSRIAIKNAAKVVETMPLNITPSSRGMKDLPVLVRLIHKSRFNAIRNRVKSTLVRH